MTYNFDPDRWYDNELAFLDHQLKSDRIALAEYETARDALEARHDAMLARLDGTYSIPDGAAARDPRPS